MTEVASVDPARHQSGGLAVALAKLNLDALTVADAVADVASMAGENVTTAIRADFKELQADFKELQADFKELRAGVNARIDTLTSETNARFTETNARIDTLTSETNARFAETNARIDAVANETNARIGETNARIDTLVGSVQSLQREISTLRWMIGVGFTLLSVFLALSTFLRGSPPVP